MQEIPDWDELKILGLGLELISTKYIVTCQGSGVDLHKSCHPSMDKGHSLPFSPLNRWTILQLDTVSWAFNLPIQDAIVSKI